jgi:hypothetical protein
MKCAYVTLWRVCRTIVATETQEYPLIFILIGASVPVKNEIKCLVLTWKCNNGFSMHCCRATKYFVLPITVISIKYSQFVALAIRHAYRIFSAPFYVIVCVLSVCAVFFHLIK